MSDLLIRNESIQLLYNWYRNGKFGRFPIKLKQSSLRHELSLPRWNVITWKA